MDILDRVFLVEFARSRRKNAAVGVDSAWHAASYKLSGYLGWPIIAIGLMCVIVAYSVSRT